MVGVSFFAVFEGIRLYKARMSVWGFTNWILIVSYISKFFEHPDSTKISTHLDDVMKLENVLITACIFINILENLRNFKSMSIIIGMTS
jgi:hypothetical protein